MKDKNGVELVMGDEVILRGKVAGFIDSSLVTIGSDFPQSVHCDCVEKVVPPPVSTEGKILGQVAADVFYGPGNDFWDNAPDECKKVWHEIAASVLAAAPKQGKPDALKPQTMQVNPHTEKLREAREKLRLVLRLVDPVAEVASDKLVYDVLSNVSVDVAEALSVVDDVIRECS